MQTFATDTTADLLLDCLASDGVGGKWSYFADLGEWEMLCNILNERYFVGRLARNLAGRGLAETRRAALGMQLRLTPAGIELAGQHQRQADAVAAEIDWAALMA